MLAKGEVKQLIVRPEFEMVTIILHEGAIVKGKRSTFRTYHMLMPNAAKLEEKIRETEKSLGISPGYFHLNSSNIHFNSFFLFL